MGGASRGDRMGSLGVDPSREGALGVAEPDPDPDPGGMFWGRPRSLLPRIPFGMSVPKGASGKGDSVGAGALEGSNGPVPGGLLPLRAPRGRPRSLPLPPLVDPSPTPPA